MDLLITNNPLVKESYMDKYQIVYEETDLLGVLTKVRDMVHKGHILITHPLMGSVKPNESPYKSVIITKTGKNPDIQSLNIIEECIQTAQKFTGKSISEKHLKDMQIVDLSLISAK